MGQMSLHKMASCEVTNPLRGHREASCLAFSNVHTDTC